MKVGLCLLVKNELPGLKALWDSIPFQSVDEVFVVDGGSDDGSIEFVTGKNTPVYRQVKRGRGAAFEMAFEKTQSDALIFFSPDGNEDPSDLWRFRPLLDWGYEMVIANRMSGGGRNEEDDRFFKLRKWVNQIFTVVANLVWNSTGPYLHDTINGYRAITKKAWQKMQPDGAGYTIEYQCSIRAMKNQLRIAEFPTYEGQRIDDKQGSPSLPTGWAFIRLFWSELTFRSKAV